MRLQAVKGKSLLLAYQDEFTGLPNRAALTEIAEKHTKHMSSKCMALRSFF